MISINPDSELLFDRRVFANLRSQESSIAFWPEEAFAELLPKIAGREPTEPYFNTPNGETLRIAWFVGYVDQSTNLRPPFQPSMLDDDLDARVADRSMPGVINWSDFNLFGDGERLIPFAALFTDGRSPYTLLWQDYDTSVGDSLCIDTSTRPHSIVYCNSLRAAEAVSKREYSGWEVALDYASFVSPISPTLAGFAGMLRSNP